MALQEKQELHLPPSEDGSTSQNLAGVERSRLLGLFIILAKRKFPIIGFTTAAAMISLVVSLLLPVYYTGNVKLLPPQQSQSMATAMLGQLSPLLGASAGKDLGLRNPNDLYVAMLRSRSVADNLIERFELMSRYHSGLPEDTRKRLDSLTEIVAGKDGVISISVDDRDPRRAAEIANAYVEELEKLTKTLAVTDAGKQRLFFEQEVKTAGNDLANAELALKQTQEKTGMFQLDNQSKVMLQAYADLRAQVANKEVQVQSMRSFANPENPDLKRAQQELAALRVQVARYEQGQNGRPSEDLALEKVPSAALEYVQKLRDVKYRESLLELLTKQYEIARIDEAKDSAIVQVMDKAVSPGRKSWPHRGSIVVLSTLLAFLLAILWAWMAEATQYAKEDPQYGAQIQLLRMYLFRGMKRS
jgi:tyrosine-protein kinase Etk/Wzc